MSDIIYLESDAEITEAIDKLKSAKKDSVKLVVPARSSLLQSVVNLKLLKKAAADHKRELILITNDKTAKYLAGGVGLAVAANLKAEAKIPEAIKEEPTPDIIEPDKSPLEEDELPIHDGNKAKSSEPDEPVVRSRSLTDDQPAVEPKKSKKSSKQPKVPNFNNLQKRTWIALGAVVGVVLLIVLATVVPSAQVTLKVNAKKLPLDLKFIADSSITKSDYPNRIVQATKLQTEKDLTGNFTATGKKDVGTKASGSVTISNASNSDPISIPGGTTLTAENLRFTLNGSTTVPGAKLQGGNIIPGTIKADITASGNGDQYNLGNAVFTIAGFNGKVTATGSTSGGTSKQVTIVSQDDIDKAKATLLDQGKDQQKSDLVEKAGKDAKAFEESFAVEVQSFSSSVAADSENSSGTVTAKVRYSLLAVKKTELGSFFEASIKSDLEKGSEIYDNGVESAKYAFIKSAGDGKAQIGATGTAYYGVPLDLKKIASDLKNKPKKQVNSLVQDYPDVTGATVDSWPPLFPNMPALDGNIKIKLSVSQD